MNKGKLSHDEYVMTESKAGERNKNMDTLKLILMTHYSKTLILTNFVENRIAFREANKCTQITLIAHSDRGDKTSEIFPKQILI